MSDLFKNKYRVDSIRLKSYNYQEEGISFITICNKNRKNYFGVDDSV
jgi:putative transposase